MLRRTGADEAVATMVTVWYSGWAFCPHAFGCPIRTLLHWSRRGGGFVNHAESAPISSTTGRRGQAKRPRTGRRHTNPAGRVRQPVFDL